MNITVSSVKELEKASDIFIKEIGENRIFSFYGSMGAGKTTFIKSICEKMGIKDVINSPSFSIINEYTLPNGNPVYHFDFYRLNKIEEACQLGYEEYFYSGNLCFIEWPEKIQEIIPEESINVTIDVLKNKNRHIHSEIK